MTSPDTPDEQSITNATEEGKPAPVHHSVWSFGNETPRQAFMGTGTGWASSFFPPTSITPGPGGEAVPAGSRERGGSVETVLNTLEHKIALLQQDLAHSWGHLNEWKRRLASEQSEVSLRSQDLDNKEKMLNELARELRQREDTIQQRGAEIDRLDQDLEARLRELGHAEVLTMVRNLEQREREVQRFAAQYDGKRAELEDIKHTAEESRRQAELDRRTAEHLHGEIGQRCADVSRREHDLEASRADLQHVRQRLCEAQQQLARREQSGAERQARVERMAQQVEARWQEICANEERLKKRGEALQRFGDFLQGTIDDCAQDPAATALERETRSLMREFAGSGEVPMPGRSGLQPAGSNESEVRQADSLNTHLFRRVRHNRPQVRDNTQQPDIGSRGPWWDT